MYKLVSIISIFIRTFILPNPYVSFIKDQNLAYLFNIVVGGIILHFGAYFFTGCIYTKGVDDPAYGSTLYLISYIILIFIIMGFGYLISILYLFITLVLSVYILLCVVARMLSNRRRSGIRF